MSKPIRGSLHAERVGGERGKAIYHWTAEIAQGDKVLWRDDCRDPQKLIPTLEAHLNAFITLANIGQKFRSWREIGDREAGKL